MYGGQFWLQGRGDFLDLVKGCRMFVLADCEREEAFLYRAGGRWWVGGQVGRQEGSARSRLCPPSLNPPHLGWEVWDGYRAEWRSCRDMSAEAGGISQGCEEVRVRGKNDRHAKYSATYRREEGSWRAGHQVRTATEIWP